MFSGESWICLWCPIKHITHTRCCQSPNFTIQICKQTKHTFLTFCWKWLYCTLSVWPQWVSAVTWDPPPPMLFFFSMTILSLFPSLFPSLHLSVCSFLLTLGIMICFPSTGIIEYRRKEQSEGLGVGGSATALWNISEESSSSVVCVCVCMSANL